MTYSVVWRPSAEAKLASIWNEADDRDAVARAGDTIDSLLRTAPLTVGESRADTSRILIVDTLAVYYDVHEDDQLVAVWAVWRPRSRN